MAATASSWFDAADFAILMRSTSGGAGRHAETCGVTAAGALGIPFSWKQAGALTARRHQYCTALELIRNTPPERQQHFNNRCCLYSNADFNALVRVLTDWSRRIHRPQGSTRIRLYPQQLVCDLLEAFNIARTNFNDDVMRDIGLFSRMILDVETVYMSVDSRQRFSDVLNFLQNAAETGYDVSTDDVLQRPDAVTVSTVHKMKGLEFPCVFVVDVEAHRFPKRR